MKVDHAVSKWVVSILRGRNGVGRGLDRVDQLLAVLPCLRTSGNEGPRGDRKLTKHVSNNC